MCFMYVYLHVFLVYILECVSCMHARMCFMYVYLHVFHVCIHNCCCVIIVVCLHLSCVYQCNASV